MIENESKFNRLSVFIRIYEILPDSEPVLSWLCLNFRWAKKLIVLWQYTLSYSQQNEVKNLVCILISIFLIRNKFIYAVNWWLHIFIHKHVNDSYTYRLCSLTSWSARLLWQPTERLIALVKWRACVMYIHLFSIVFWSLLNSPKINKSESNVLVLCPIDPPAHHHYYSQLRTHFMRSKVILSILFLCIYKTNFFCFFGALLVRNKWRQLCTR